VFLAAVGADETRVEASFCEAIRIAKEQKSLSLEKRTEATYAEYHRQKNPKFVPVYPEPRICGECEPTFLRRFQTWLKKPLGPESTRKVR
jgi:hypothetical protein